jgi:hypothetical protein
MFERIAKSFELVGASWAILMEDKKLLAFPVLSGIVTLLVVATFILPLILVGGAGEIATGSAASILVLFLFYLVSYAVVIFFNVGLIACVSKRMQGQETSIGDGLNTAVRHLGRILAWAAVAATVGLILRIIEDRAGFLGQIAAAIVGGAWSLVTFFVVPVLVFEEKGVFPAIRESFTLFKKTWGETVVGSVSIGLVFMLIGIAGALCVFATLLLGSWMVFLAALALFILLVVVLAVIASAMQGIFVVALYTYAKTGQVPGAFRKDLIEQAFVQKSPSMRAGNI